MKPITIGGGAAFFIDSAMAVPQLLGAGVDYILLDYLAEGAMGLLGRMKKADPQGGFPGDFMDVHIGPFLTQIAATGTKIMANAGGVNPEALAALLRARIADLGLNIPVAVVTGDDLMDQLPDLADARDMFTGAPFPRQGVTSCNAYLGAFPIAKALADGAQIVLTGRVVDSALALGPLIHEFGWGAEDWDKLAGGTIAGHLIECGPQATGGTFTDWHQVEGWENIGAPMVECFADGSCIVTKPEGTGGLVSRGTVAEQMLYEVSDPQAYFVPDVTCDMSAVSIEEIGKDRVRVSGAKGYAPPATLKACVTWDDGWRATAYQPLIGPEARVRAEKQAKALFARGNLMLRGRNMADWRRTEAVMIGSDTEIILKLAAEHDEMLGAQMFVREQFAAISAMSPGTSVAFGPQVAPMMHLISFTVPRDRAVPRVNGVPCPDPARPAFCADDIERPSLPEAAPASATATTLEALAFARSGEKGETINVGVIARNPAHLPALKRALTEQALRDWLPDLGDFRVTVYDLPGPAALNIVMDGALPGGLNASQRFDPAAKTIAQRLMRFPVAL
ncbi:MAG: acyclic terpene utilization AtuA family protein [Chakrabartia sp.]